MTRTALRSCLVLLLAAGCSGPPGSSADADALLDLWTGWDTAAPTAPGDYDRCNAFGAYGASFGVRGLACIAQSIAPLGDVVDRAGVPVFESGPHTTQGARFALTLDGQEFGRYNPAFVQWGIDNAIVGEDDAAVRALATPIYRRHFQRISRVYWAVYDDLAADGFPGSTPAGVTQDYVDYLRGGEIGRGEEDYYPGFSMYAFSELNDGVVSRIGYPQNATEHYSALYEANTARGFWLRRREDGTLGLFRDGLERLLATYDAEWLRSNL